MKLNNKSELKALKRGKSEDEKKVIDYFLATGCLTGAMSDEEYDAMVSGKINSLNAKAKALQKIGLDEDQLKEIPPVFFYGYEDYINKSQAYGKLGKDGIFRTSAYSVTYLFFSNTQVYMYSIICDMASGAKKENTEEYFYKDITNFNTSNETVEYMEFGGCGGAKATKKQFELSKFGLIVPGDKFYCSTSGVKDADTAVNAMKQKLREKKG